jgi:hypothetical protein
MSNKKVNTGGEKKMQGRGVAGNCLHPPIAKTKHGLARSPPFVQFSFFSFLFLVRV